LVVVVVSGEVVVVACSNEVLVVVEIVTFDGVDGASAGLDGPAGPVRVPRSAVVETTISDRSIVTVGLGCVAGGWEPRTPAITGVDGVGDTTPCRDAPTETRPVAREGWDGDDAEPLTT
jgi:hypothetical protein